MQQSFDYIIIGAGTTGASVARYLHAQGKRFAVVDNRTTPPQAECIKQQVPNASVHYGNFAAPFRAPTLILSPGLAPEQFSGRYGSHEIIGDIELFVRNWHKPLIAVTGTNGKSTLVSLIEYACRHAGINAVAVGNIGTAALDVLNSDATVAVVEISSFQLLTTASLHADVAIILNITPDHLDRHGSFTEYIQAKRRIFTGARSCVVRADDPLTQPQGNNIHKRTLIAGKPHDGELGYITKDDVTTLFDGAQPICTTQECALQGAETTHTLLTAYAIAQLMQFPLGEFSEGMKRFPGLPHRMEHIATINDVCYINDSKATNVGATIKALESITVNETLNNNIAKHKLTVLLGGDAKDADFTDLISKLTSIAPCIIVYGADNTLPAAIARAAVPHHRVTTLDQAVALAHTLAQPGDTVLLSPACASLDQFRNFTERGEAFACAVSRLCRNEEGFVCTR